MTRATTEGVGRVKRVHYGAAESGTDMCDAWAECHNPYEREDSKLTMNWNRVTCKRCLKRAPNPFRTLLLTLARGAHGQA